MSVWQPPGSGSREQDPSATGQPAPPPPPQVVARHRQAAMVRSGGTWFYYIAGLSLVNSILFWAGSNWSFVVGLGITDAANVIGHDGITGATGMAIAIVFDLAIAGGFAGLGYLARKGTTWAFIVGMVVYLLDGLLLVWVTDWLSVAFHALALFYIVRGFRASRALRATAAQPPATTTGIAPPIVPR